MTSNPAASTITRIRPVVILLLALLGFAGTYSSLPVAFGVTFVFGSISSVIALRLFGLPAGLAVAFAASLYTWPLWGHPYAIIIFMAEITWLGFFLRRGRSNLLLLDCAYWLCLGMPLVALFYGAVMTTPPLMVALVAVKQGINGVFNTLIATLVLTFLPLARRLIPEGAGRQPTLAGIVFQLTAAVMVIPPLAVFLAQMYQEVSSQHEKVREELTAGITETAADLKAWHERQLHGVGEIGHLGEHLGFTPSPPLQTELVRLRRIYPDFHSVTLADAAGTAVGSVPELGGRGGPTVGLKVSDTPFSRQLPTTKQPVVSRMFRGLNGAPTFTIAAPVERHGKLAGFGLGAVDVNRLIDLLTVRSKPHSLFLTLVDAGGTVVASSDPALRPLTRFIPPERRGTVERVSGTVFLSRPAPAKNRSLLAVWQDASYVANLPLGIPGWRLHATFPLAGLQRELFQQSLRAMTIIAVLLGVSLLVARWIATLLARTPTRLAALTRDLPQRLERGETVTWPASPIAELTQLTENFRIVAEALAERFAALRQTQQTLEERVAERTAELLGLEIEQRTVLDTATVGIARVRNRAVIWCNRTMADMLGYSPDELAQVPTQQFYPDDAAWELTGACAYSCLSRGETYQTERQLIRRDGTTFWVNLSGRLIDTSNPDAGSVWSIADISERKRLEAALLLTQASVDAASDAIFWIGPDHRILEVNPATCRSLGYSREELLTMTISDINPEKEQEQVDRFLGEDRKAGSLTFETLRMAKDGRIFPVEVSLSYVPYGTEERFLDITRDITERKQRELKIRNYRDIVEHSDDAIISKSLDGIVTSWNRGAERIFGYGAAEMIGRSTSLLIPAELIDEEKALLARLAGGETIQHLTTRRRRDGVVIHVSVTLSPIRDEWERITGVSIIARDISDEVRHEEELARARDAAEAANRAKSLFLANMSHEIRTPLNGVLGLAQLLEDEPLTPRQKEMVSRLRETGTALLVIINDILDFSKIEAGQLRIESTEFALAPLLARQESVQGRLARARGLSFRFEAATQPGLCLRGDPVRLEQILLNLINNAVKFTEKGEVCLRVEPLPVAAGPVRLRFEVRDTGIGITQEAQAALFRPFTQADASITRRFGGTGLGLSICKRLVEMMGGEIGVASTAGVGSSFWFELPFETAAPCPEEPASGTPVSLSAGQSLAGRRILVVDDSPVNREVVVRTLRKQRVDTVQAGDGREALALLAADPGGFDLVLMDIQMPELDGIAATRALRHDLGLVDLPVVAFTAGVYDEDRRAALDAGVNDFLPKPVDLNALIALLRRWLPPSTVPPPLAGISANVNGSSPDFLPPLQGEGRGGDGVKLRNSASYRNQPHPPPNLPLEGGGTISPESSPPSARGGGEDDAIPAIPGIDPERVAAIFGDDRDFFLELLDTFLAESGDAAGAVRDELPRDREAAARRLHALKGSAGNVGATGVAAGAHALEEALRSGSGDPAPLLEELAAELTELRRQAAP